MKFLAILFVSTSDDFVAAKKDAYRVFRTELPTSTDVTSQEKPVAFVFQRNIMHKRVIMRLELEPGSKKGLDEFCDRTGMTKVAALSRLIDWFCSQPDNVQAIIQGLIPKFIAPDVAEIILERLATTKKGQGTFKPANNHRAGTMRIGQRHNGTKIRSKSNLG
jgi:hypothetical protein